VFFQARLFNKTLSGKEIRDASDADPTGSGLVIAKKSSQAEVSKRRKGGPKKIPGRIEVSLSGIEKRGKLDGVRLSTF